MGFIGIFIISLCSLIFGFILGYRSGKKTISKLIATAFQYKKDAFEGRVPRGN